MKKYFFILMSFLIFGMIFAGCSILNNSGVIPTNVPENIPSLIKASEADPDEYPLYAKRNILVGEVLVWNDDDNLFVRYELNQDALTDGWLITETHLAVGTDKDDIPANKKGSPIPNQFPYGDDNLEGVPFYQECLSFEDLGVEGNDELVIAAFAVIEKAKGKKKVVNEDVWGAEGPGEIRFVEKGKGKWETYFRYSVDLAPATVIDIAAIPGVNIPVIGATPVTAITETTQYTGTVSWNPTDNLFLGSTVYTATITILPKAGFTLIGVVADFFTVAGAISVTNSANSGVITAVFPQTVETTPEKYFIFVVSTKEIIDYHKKGGLDVVIPPTIGGIAVEYIGNDAFNEKGLTSVIIPDSVTIIGNGAFSYNQLASVTIGNSVTIIDNGAFRHNQLTSVTIPDSVTMIGSCAFLQNQLTSVTIGNSVTSIGDHAFRENQLTSVTIPDSVTTIGDNVFYYNQLTSVTIGNSLTTISDNAFSFNQLTSVIIPDSVTMIGYSAFARNQLTSVTIGNSVRYISDSAFSLNQLTSVTIPDSVWDIGPFAFNDNNLTSITIPDSVTDIGRGAFMNNNLTSITIPDSVTMIGSDTFYNNNLTSITIPDSVTMIDINAFGKNQLTSITIGDGVDIDSGINTMGTNLGFQTVYDNGGQLAGTYNYNTVIGWIKE